MSVYTRPGPASIRPAALVDAIIELAVGGGGDGDNVTVLEEQEFAPAAGATTVTLAALPADVLSVFRNGLEQSLAAGHYTVAGADLTFSAPFAAGERVSVVYSLGTSVLVDAYTKAQSDFLFLTQAEADAAYQALAQKGQASGYAPLDAAGKVPTAHLPPLAVTETFVVASEGAMLALPAQTGDVAIRTDTGRTYILAAEPAATLANWQEVVAAGQVQSVNGETGVVTLTAADVGALTQSEADGLYRPISYVTDVTVSGTEGVTVVESPANSFALGLTASPDANNTIEIRANGIYAAAGAIPPEYVTDAELAAALAPYATDTDLADHAAAADPHAVYQTEAAAAATYVPLAGGSVLTGGLGPSTTNTRDLGTTALRWARLWTVNAEFTNVPTVNGVSMDSRYEPFDSAYTKAEADARYSLQAHAHAGVYLPIGGGTLTGALTVSAGGIAVTGASTFSEAPTVGGSALLTQAAGDGRYSLTAHAHTGTYLPLSGGTLTGALAVSSGGVSVTVDTGFVQVGATNPAGSGSVRLRNSNYVTWRNAANTADLSLGVNNANTLITTTHLAPSGINIDLGLTASRWRKLWTTDADLSGTLNVAGAAATFTNAPTVGGSPLQTQTAADARYLQSATAATTYVPLAGGSVLTGLLGPSTTNTRDLGTSTLRWRKTWGVDADLSGSLVVAVALTVAAKAVALSATAGNTLAWNADGFWSDAPTKAQYDALVARVAALEGQMGAGANGHYHLMGSWRQTAKATLPATTLEEVPAA
jgi:hypothetical protein